MPNHIRHAYPEPFLEMPSDYVKCPQCGVYRQVDADDIVTPCHCGHNEYPLKKGVKS